MESVGVPRREYVGIMMGNAHMAAKSCADNNRGFPNSREPFWGPYNKDYSIWGLHWGPPFSASTICGNQIRKYDMFTLVITGRGQ